MNPEGLNPTPEELENKDEQTMPSEAEMTNLRNEATEINEMVDKGLLTPEEASEFDYEKEIDIPKALLEKPPVLSERLRQQVIDKFPPNTFKPDCMMGLEVHGTSIKAVRPLWLGEGGVRTYYHGDYNGPRWTRGDAKNIFYLIGYSQRVPPTGFQKRTEFGRLHAFSFSLPIYVLFDSPRSASFSSRGERRMNPYNNPAALVLTAMRARSASAIIEGLQRELKDIEGYTEEGNTLSWTDADSYLSYVPDYRRKEIEETAEAEAGRIVAETQNDKSNSYWKKFLEKATEKYQRYPELYPPVEKATDLSDPKIARHFQRIVYLDILPRTCQKELSREEIEAGITKRINELKNAQEKAGTEPVYQFSTSVESEKPTDHYKGNLFLTTHQAANYIAHCMVQGVDKSKIVPIYDWDSKLLWPLPPQNEEEKQEEIDNFKDVPPLEPEPTEEE